MVVTPALVTFSRCAAFVFTTKSVASVVPTKFVPAVVPAFPDKFQAVEDDELWLLVVFHSAPLLISVADSPTVASILFVIPSIVPVTVTLAVLVVSFLIV